MNTLKAVMASLAIGSILGGSLGAYGAVQYMMTRYEWVDYLKPLQVEEAYHKQLDCKRFDKCSAPVVKVSSVKK